MHPSVTREYKRQSIPGDKFPVGSCYDCEVTECMGMAAETDRVVALYRLHTGAPVTNSYHAHSVLSLYIQTG